MYELAIWGENNTSSSPKTISENNFSIFLELCFKNATYFSLNKAPWTDSIRKDLQTRLEPFLVKEILTPTWFGYDYSMAPPEDYRQLKVFLYNAEIIAKDIFLECFSDVFLKIGQGGTLLDSLQTLEDLCFFSQESLFVGTVSHEFLLGVFPPNREFETFMKKLGDWNYINQTPMNVQKYIL